MALERVDGDGSGIAWPKPGLGFAARRAETLLVLLVLGVVLVIGLATAADYGLSTDEFNTDDYGPKALAWSTSLQHRSRPPRRATATPKSPPADAPGAVRECTRRARYR